MTRLLGVVGTLVWDTIQYRDGREEPTEEWGGIGYSIEALSATLPEGWEILPILKVGGDLSEAAFRFLRGIPRVRAEPGVLVVPEPNNRVDLHYRDGVRITERLSGGVPAWEWTEIAPLTRLCDALYVNFISGFELELETARTLRATYPGPIYADLHSLFLAIDRHGDRIPRPLPHAMEWLRSFDAVQMNETEFELLGRAWGDPWNFAAEVVGPELKLIAVTLGARGAAYVTGGGFDSDPFTWPGTRHRMALPGTSRSGRIEPEGAPSEGDTTGCGDVWGGTCFARLLAGDTLDEAMRKGNRLAARNVDHRGATGLGHHLTGTISRGGFHG